MYLWNTFLLFLSILFFFAFIWWPYTDFFSSLSRAAVGAPGSSVPKPSEVNQLKVSESSVVFG